jgi:hypothetical protein
MPSIRLRQVWLVLPLAFAFAYGTAMPVTHTDFYYHLLLGRLIVEQGGWLWHETVTYAPSREPWLNLPWLSQVVYYALQRAGGSELVSLWHAGVVAVTFLGVQRLGMHLGAGARLACAAVLASLALGATNLAVRPQSLALPLFVGLVWTLEAAQVRRLPLATVLITVVWANVHGSFVLAPLVVGAYLVGTMLETRSLRSTRVQVLVVSLFGSMAATLLNPLGPAAYEYAVSVGQNPTVRSFIQEWQPPAPGTLLGALFFASILPAAAVLWLGRRRVRATHLLLLGGLLALALVAQRNVIWWALAMPPLVAGHLGFWILDFGFGGLGVVGLRRPAVETEFHPRTKSKIQNPKSKILNAALLVVVLAIAGLGLPWVKPSNPLLAPELRSVLDPQRPEGVASFMERAGLRGRVLARMEWGGYLAWRLWPEVRPFLDARIEQHPAHVWRDYFAIMAAHPGWEALVDGYGTDFLAVDWAFSPALSRELMAHAGWRELYRDEQAVLFARSLPRS